jgi:hypothetical protein
MPEFKPLKEMNKNELVDALGEAMHNIVLPLQKTIDHLTNNVISLEKKLIKLEYVVAKMRACIPEMQRLRGFNEPEIVSQNYTVVSSDVLAPTKEKHNCQCSDCDPEC